MSYRFFTNDDIQDAKDCAIAFWRTCNRPDMSEEDKVRGALVKYQMRLDSIEMTNEAKLAEIFGE